MAKVFEVTIREVDAEADILVFRTENLQILEDHEMVSDFAEDGTETLEGGPTSYTIKGLEKIE
jgi:hypothetical protein